MKFINTLSRIPYAARKCLRVFTLGVAQRLNPCIVTAAIRDCKRDIKSTCGQTKVALCGGLFANLWRFL